MPTLRHTFAGSSPRFHCFEPGYLQMYLCLYCVSEWLENTIIFASWYTHMVHARLLAEPSSTAPTDTPWPVPPVFYIYRDWSRSRIKSFNPKNQIWDLSRNKWYLSQSGCGIKSGINTTFLARNCGSALTAQSRRTTEPGVLGAWPILRDIGTSARNRRVIESTL